METILAIRPVPGEPGRFFCTSRTLFCADTHGCRFSYQYKGVSIPNYSVGDACPKCGKTLETVDYLADLTQFAGLGFCSCHRWQMHLQPIVTKLAPTQLQAVRESDSYRCPHLVAAMRVFALEKIDEQNRATLRGRRDSHCHEP